MSDTLFPIYPVETRMINSTIGIKAIAEKVVYFNSGGPIYEHLKDDYQNFRFITSQMIALKQVQQVEIINFFKVSKESVIRWSKKYKEKGAKGFFGTKKVTKRGNILTENVLEQVQILLNRGKSLKEIGQTLNIKPDTLQKAIQSGRLTRPIQPVEIMASNEKTQSQRNLEDINATLGVGCTNEQGRLEAIVKKK
jgi:hypothetical protein